MKKKNVKTVNQNQEQEGSGEYGAPIYLNLNGNDAFVNNFYLLTSIDKAHEYGSTLYVNANAGAPKNPPSCLPGMPGYPNCH